MLFRSLIENVSPESAHSCAAIDDVLRTLAREKIKVSLAYLPLGPNRLFPENRYHADFLLRCLRERPNFTSFEEPLRDDAKYFFSGDTHLNQAGVDFVVEKLAPLLSR